MVAFNTFNEWLVDFYQRRKTDPSLRLGQAFANAFDITNPTLYYQEDDTKARQMIIEVYVQM